MIDTAPLHNRFADEPIAWLSEPLTCLGESQGIVSVRDFMSHVQALSYLLPERQHAINLCNNRYLFLVGLCACTLRAQTSLMPSNKNVVTQQGLSEDHRETYIIHDGATDIAATHNLNLMDCDLSTEISHHRSLDQQNAASNLAAAQIPLDQLAVICFTSGSTGKPKPNKKTWRTLVESTAINSRYMLPNQNETFYHLATVPGQHMWGFETSVLMPLFSKVCMIDARPSFPHDIANLLQRMPQPRAIITTPLHLRALTSSNVTLPELANILCATAPLNQQLADETEQKFDTTVREVYGCSEVGSMAIRQTAETERWIKFDKLEFKPMQSGRMLVSAAHLLDAVQLEDAIEMHDQDSFSLRGRVSDQIKIAGKRGSLHEVNKVLQSFQGLSDGVVFFPEQKRAVPRLVALVVLHKGIEKNDLRAHFQKHLDTAFVPRPIVEVSQLPREESGKLKKSRLLEFYQSSLSKP